MKHICTEGKSEAPAALRRRLDILDGRRTVTFAHDIDFLFKKSPKKSTFYGRLKGFSPM